MSFSMPTFNPPQPATLESELPFSKLKELEAAAANSDKPFVMFFIGGVKIEAKDKKLFDDANSFYDNDGTLAGTCSFTMMCALAYANAGFEVLMHKINYDDKPAWYLASERSE